MLKSVIIFCALFCFLFILAFHFVNNVLLLHGRVDLKEPFQIKYFCCPSAVWRQPPRKLATTPSLGYSFRMFDGRWAYIFESSSCVLIHNCITNLVYICNLENSVFLSYAVNFFLLVAIVWKQMDVICSKRLQVCNFQLSFISAHRTSYMLCDVYHIPLHHHPSPCRMHHGRVSIKCLG